MSPDDIKHFLITFDPSTDDAAVRFFGTDYDAAQAAYAEAEQANGLGGNLALEGGCLALEGDAGGGTRTPDTRIMIPLL